jgi:histidine triad (HIT) family protein
MNDCLFCRIVSGEIASERIFEDELCLVFRDIHAQAPTHLLVVPKRHLSSTAEGTERDASLYGHLISTAAEVARGRPLVDGYRLVINTGADGGQTVHHLHVHLLGGRAMDWPPG